MVVRRRILLMFTLLGFLPAIALASAIYFFNQNESRLALESNVSLEARQTAARLRTALRSRKDQVALLGRGANLIEFASANRSADLTRADAPPVPPSVANTFLKFDELNGGDLRAVYFFRGDQELLLAGERPMGANQPFQFRGTSGVNPPLDQSAWTKARGGQVIGELTRAGVARYFVPVMNDAGPPDLLVMDLSLAGLLDREFAGDLSRQGHVLMVLDRQGALLNNTPGRIRFQPVTEGAPEFAPVAAGVAENRPGAADVTNNGIRYFVAHRPEGEMGLSVAVMQARNIVSAFARWAFAGALLAAVAMFVVAAYWFTQVMRREQRGIDRVTQGAAEIAAGKLNQRIEVRSSAELQALANSFNLMAEQLREQISRETEARQFRSFMRLSATVTHDLKNAIQALTLLVKNMETHFDNPEFRAQALTGLTRATDKLNALVARLSEPMRSMSGELPQLQPTDLAIMIRKTLAATAELDRTGHTIVNELPEKLVAHVDAERIEKVFENLIINALQAMEAKPGTLTINAESGEKDCTITVSDTGKGMNEAFLRDKLFRAFATTKPLGIGLGLYTCREVVRAHGGTITAESESGSGTTFRVVLPLRARALWTN